MVRRKSAGASRHASALASLITLLISSLDIQTANAAQVALTWNKTVDTRVTGYEIAYGTTSQGTTGKLDAGNTSAYTIPGLEDGRTYFFRVRSYNSAKTTLSVYSNEVSKTTAAATPVPTAAPASGTALTSIFGGPAGSSFADQLTSNQRLTRVEIRAGWVVDAVQAITNTGALPRRGGTGGNLSGFNLDADEYIVGISGKYRTYISQVTFRTSKNRTYGPYGEGRDVDGTYATATFDITARSGQELVGFAGRAGSYLNALGAIQRLRAATPTVAPVATATPTPVPTAVPTPIPTATPRPQPTATPSSTPAVSTGSKSTTYGVAGGTEFDDRAGSNQRLTSITVRAGWWIDSVQVSINGTAKALRGGTGGTPNTFTIPADDYLVSISGKYGSYVSQLTFKTKSGKTFGPFGEGRNVNGSYATNTFGFTAPAGSEIVGLAGRASGYLNAISAVHRTRQTASTTTSPSVQATQSPASAPATPWANTVGLVAAYDFDETSGTTVVDRSGYGHHGQSTNVTRITQGRFGNAMAFSGSQGSNVTVNDSDALDFTTGMTMEAWVYRTSTTAGWGGIVSKEQSPSGVAYYLYANTTYDDRPVTGIRSDAYHELQGAQPFPANQWVHLAGTYDGTAQRLYVNGRLVSSEPRTGRIQVSEGVLRIGGSGSEKFTGYIDEVRLYNRALSAEEVAADMSRPVAQTGNVSTLLGNTALAPNTDELPAGRALAFQVGSNRVATLSSVSVYVEAGSKASNLIAGVYADGDGQPGKLLASATFANPVTGWNTVPLTTASALEANRTYWISFMSPAGGGSLRYRNSNNAGGRAQDSSSSSLSKLPGLWSAGLEDTSAPYSAYVSGY